MELLIINVLADGIPGLALAKEESDTRIMKRKPFDRNESFFSGGLMEVIIQQTIIGSIVILAGYYIGKFIQIHDAYAPSHSIGQAMAFLILGWTSIIRIFTVRSRSSMFRRAQKENPQLALSAAAMFLILGCMVAIPPLASVLGYARMSGSHWLIIAGFTLIPTLVAEYEKLWDNYKYHVAEKNRVAQQRIE